MSELLWTRFLKIIFMKHLRNVMVCYVYTIIFYKGYIENTSKKTECSWQSFFMWWTIIGHAVLFFFILVFSTVTTNKLWFKKLFKSCATF